MRILTYDVVDHDQALVIHMSGLDLEHLYGVDDGTFAFMALDGF